MAGTKNGSDEEEERERNDGSSSFASSSSSFSSPLSKSLAAPRRGRDPRTSASQAGPLSLRQLLRDQRVQPLLVLLLLGLPLQLLHPPRFLLLLLLLRTAAAAPAKELPPRECRTVRSLLCGAGSKRQPGRTPGGGVFCARGPECVSSTTSLALSVLCPRRAWYDTGPTPNGAEWCWATDRANATLSCSCLHHERWRRSRLRLAAEVASQVAMGLLLRFGTTGPHKKKATPEPNAWWWWWGGGGRGGVGEGGGGEGGWWWWWWFYRAFTNACVCSGCAALMHRIQWPNTWDDSPRRRHRHSTSKWTECKKCRKNAAK